MHVHLSPSRSAPGEACPGRVPPQLWRRGASKSSACVSMATCRSISAWRSVSSGSAAPGPRLTYMLFQSSGAVSIWDPWRRTAGIHGRKDLGRDPCWRLARYPCSGIISPRCTLSKPSLERSKDSLVLRRVSVLLTPAHEYLSDRHSHRPVHVAYPSTGHIHRLYTRSRGKKESVMDLGNQNAHA
jgi:hypothetical protein